LDTSAWIELFEETKNTNKVKAVLLSEECHTSIVSIAEIVNWAVKGKREHAVFINGIDRLSTVIEADEEIAKLAGKLNFERKKKNKKWGMMDSFVLATSLTYGLEILTKDSDFEDLPNVILLK
jgi:predicted nucleic acid-binding protein